MGETPTACAAVLHNIEEIDWGALSHAYGAASMVPGALRAAVDADADAELADDAMESLFDGICHQGTLYSATAPIVPFIAGLLMAADTPRRSDFLHLLSSIAEARDATADPMAAFLERCSEPGRAAQNTRRSESVLAALRAVGDPRWRGPFTAELARGNVGAGSILEVVANGVSCDPRLLWAARQRLAALTTLDLHSRRTSCAQASAIARLREAAADRCTGVAAARALRRILGETDPLIAAVRTRLERCPPGKWLVAALRELGAEARPLLPELREKLAEDRPDLPTGTWGELVARDIEQQKLLGELLAETENRLLPPPRRREKPMC